MAKKQSVLLWSGALFAYLFLYLPLVIVVVYSFNDSKLNAEWVGFTLDWYHKLFNNREMLVAARAAGCSASKEASVSAMSCAAKAWANTCTWRSRRCTSSSLSAGRASAGAATATRSSWARQRSSVR